MLETSHAEKTEIIVLCAVVGYILTSPFTCFMVIFLVRKGRKHTEEPPPNDTSSSGTNLVETSQISNETDTTNH